MARLRGVTDRCFDRMRDGITVTWLTCFCRTSSSLALSVQSQHPAQPTETTVCDTVQSSDRTAVLFSRTRESVDSTLRTT